MSGKVGSALRYHFTELCLPPRNARGRLTLSRRAAIDVDSVPMLGAPHGWPFLERLTLLIELAQNPVERRAGDIAERGLLIAEVEARRVEAH